MLFFHQNILKTEFFCIRKTRVAAHKTSKNTPYSADSLYIQKNALALSQGASTMLVRSENSAYSSMLS